MTDATCQQDCDNLATGPGGGGAGGDDSGGSSIIVIVIIVLALFLLTAVGYLYWRRKRGEDNGKDGDLASTAGGWFSRKDKETQSQKTAKADDLSVTPYMVRRKIHFRCVYFTPSFHSTDVFSILAR